MHAFKFPRYSLLVHRDNRDILYLVECRHYDADKGGSPVYMLTPSTTECMERWGAEYVEATFSEHVQEQEEENGY